MKTIFKIAKTELRILFYSPIAWFLLIVFFIQCGIVYLGQLEMYARQQDLGGWSLYYMHRLTAGIFTGSSGLFLSVMEKLYLYVPLLTMGIISRETSSGTIRLLYSSPISVRDIVLGKYLAMMIYSFLMLVVIGVFTTAGMFHIQSVDTGTLFSALLGFYLLLCTYSAIGLFMSSLTTYQVVAAICTFVMIGILSYIGTVWQKYEIVRTITYFLSLSGRTENMLRGLIVSKDLIYFLVIIFAFISFTIYRMKAGMESKPAAVKAARYVAIVVIALGVGYVGSRHHLTAWYDVSAGKSMTIAPKEQTIVEAMKDGPLQVTTYVNVLDRYRFLGAPESRNDDLDRWEPYMRFKNDIDLKYVHYYDSTFDEGVLSSYPGKNLKEIADMFVKSDGGDLSGVLTPEQMRKKIDLRPENYRYVMHLQYQGRQTFLRVFDDMIVWPMGAEMTAAFNRLLQAKLPKIMFITGDLERDINRSGDREYRTMTSDKKFRYALINQGFDMDTLSLEHQDIPSDVSILVLADPKMPLGAAAMGRLQHYIDRGGNLLIAGEPAKRDVMNPLIRQFGVQLMEGIIAQPSKDLAPDIAMPLITPAASLFSKILEKEYNDSMGLELGMVSRKVSMPGVAPLSVSDTGAFRIMPLLMSNDSLSWLKKDKLVADSAAIVFNPANGDEKKSFPVAVSVTRKVGDREQRIIITGDADFISNAELMRYNVKTANFTFNTALFSWLCYNAFPIDGSRPDDKDTRVNVELEDMGRIRIIYLWLVPGLMAAGAAILLIRRKRK